MKKAHVFEAAIVLLLVVLACLLYVSIVWPQPGDGGWESADNGAPDYLFVGSNDTLYTFSGNQIAAIKSNGSLLWKLDVPAQWVVIGNMASLEYDGDDYGLGPIYQRPVAIENAGYLYVYLVEEPGLDDLREAQYYTPGITPEFIHQQVELVAISPTGTVEWEHGIDSRIATGDFDSIIGDFYSNQQLRLVYGDIADLKAYGDRLYLYHDGREDVFATNGTLLYTMYRVSGPAAVNEYGYAYAVMAAGDVQTWPQNDRNAILHRAVLAYMDRLLSGEVQPSSTIGAFGPDGTLLWTRDLGESAVRIPRPLQGSPGFGSMPLELNGTLYVQVHNGLAALDEAGNVLWARHLAGGSYVPFEIMPVDSRGNFYFNSIDGSGDAYHLASIGGDGRVDPNPWTFSWSLADQGLKVPVLVTGSDGVLYTTDSRGEMSRDEFNRTYLSRDFQPGSVSAYDLAANRTLWTFDVPAEDAHAAILTPENYGKVANRGWTPDIVSDDIVAYTTIMQFRVIDVYPGRNVTYLHYASATYENPVFLNRSRGIYVSELYALDSRGRLLWKQPVSSIKQATVSNDTIFYSTWDGRMGGGSADLAAGIAVVALLYLFLRFFVVGAVSRAKSRLDVNENRNRLLEYISVSPGATAMEIARGLGLNLGTLRYHLLILSMNHKVVAYQDGDKYVRYFKNSGTYAPEEQMLLSLMRRKPVRKTLEALAEKPGLSGIELSRELGISDTAAYRHVNLLVERNVVTREWQGDKGYLYSLRDEFKPYLAGLVEKQ